MENVVEAPAATLRESDPIATVYGPTPPKGETRIEPFPDGQVAAVGVQSASKPATTLISGKVPHFGAMVEGLASSTAQVSFGEAEVQAKNKFIIFNDSPHPNVICLFEGKVVVADFGMLGAQANMDSDDFRDPSLLKICNVPQRANDVRVEPVLLLIVSISVLVPPQAQGSLLGGGSDAPTSSRSLDVQEEAEGKF